jgi:hypothetical protein
MLSVNRAIVVAPPGKRPLYFHRQILPTLRYHILLATLRTALRLLFKTACLRLVDFKERTLKATRLILLFLIQAIANLFCQGVDGEGLLQEPRFGAQDAVANHHIVRIAALEEYP